MSFKNHFAIPSCASLLLLSLSLLTAQQQNAPPTNVAGIPVNYVEARVGTYTLPDPLVFANGKKVRDANEWSSKRRPEVVRLFEENQFGRSPGPPADLSFDVFDKGTPALDGKAIRRQVTIYFSRDKSGPKMDLLIYLPVHASNRVPLFLNLSFTANSSAVDDPGVKAGEVWGRDKKRAPAPKGGALWAPRRAAVSGAGNRRGHGLLRRHRPRFSWRCALRRALALFESREDRTGGERVGRDRSVGVGPESRDGLSRNR